MDLQSPLTQQARPDVLKPKVVGLYEELFQEEHIEPDDGFWHSLFLLRPDQDALNSILLRLSADDLLHRNLPTQEIFLRATEYVKRGENPTDENALDTLAVFLESVLSKRYPNPSSDTITVLAGLEDADYALSGFVNTLEGAINHGRTLDIRRKAVRAAIAAVAGAYQTGLVSYLVNRDLFPSLLKLIQDADEPFRTFAPCALLGLLVNYNKFEFQNPYQLRIEDFANESVLRRVGEGMSDTFTRGRQAYLAIQDDVQEGWDLNSTLSWVGLGRLTKPAHHHHHQQPVMTEEDMKVAFATQPIPEAALLLSTYDFINSNKVFCLSFSSPPTDQPKSTAAIDEFVTFTSYLVQNAYRSTRASLYSQLILLIFRILLEDPSVARSLCNGELLANVRLCRQRQPLLPPARDARTRIASMLDVLADGINHNLRRRLDVDLYIGFLDAMFRAFSYMTRSRARIIYHWSELWRSLMGLLRFLATYANDLRLTYGIDRLTDQLISLLAFALSAGESFLPDEKSYDDLFYKIFESGDVLTKVGDAYEMSKRPTAANMEMLINVSKHYQSLLEEKKGKGARIGTREVSRLIKEGYETLSLRSKEALDQWTKYREADHRNLIKKVTRTAVQDMRMLLAERTP